MADQNTVQWWAFLIGKIKKTDLSEENKNKLTKEQAVKQAQLICGEVPLKDWDPAAGETD